MGGGGYDSSAIAATVVADPWRWRRCGCRGRWWNQPRYSRYIRPSLPLRPSCVPHIVSARWVLFYKIGNLSCCVLTRTTDAIVMKSLFTRCGWRSGRDRWDGCGRLRGGKSGERRCGLLHLLHVSKQASSANGCKCYCARVRHGRERLVGNLSRADPGARCTRPSSSGLGFGGGIAAAVSTIPMFSTKSSNDGKGARGSG